MKKFFTILFATVILTYSVSANAQSEGFYLGAGLGVNHVPDATISSNPDKTSIDFNEGLTAKTSVGYDFGNNWRAEIQASRRKNENDSSANVGGLGHVVNHTLMTNVLYDFNNQSKFTPYLGGGLGYAWLYNDNVRPLNGTQGVLDSNSGEFAYQAIAGIAYDLMESVKATFEYSYIGSNNHNSRTINGTSVDRDFESHDFVLGLRWNFGKAKKVYKASSSRPTPNNYTVFFDFDKSELSPEGAQIISLAAEDFKKTGSVKIDVIGHTDRAGTEQYNMGLSKRRAKAVSDKLSTLGVVKNDISVTAKGESSPLVDTPDGIREPQNRRAEIVITQ